VTRSNLTAIRDSINWVGWPPRIRRLLLLLSQRCGISFFSKTSEFCKFANNFYAQFQNSTGVVGRMVPDNHPPRSQWSHKW